MNEAEIEQITELVEIATDKLVEALNKWDNRLERENETLRKQIEDQSRRIDNWQIQASHSDARARAAEHEVECRNSVIDDLNAYNNKLLIELHLIELQERENDRVWWRQIRTWLYRLVQQWT